ncbi:unnamed protein product [Meganyctiphanes norvegica]|uniref:Innexin n=1 Tax=Meganyctiphanes norvegica TaxID=48144 RepID=A0AAV2R3R9_MEGNR
MFEVFGGIYDSITNSRDSRPSVSSWVFGAMRMSALATMCALMLVTAKGYIGDNISCLSDFKGQEHKAVETYCFISATYTIVGLDENLAPHPGVGPSIGKQECEDDDEDCETGDNMKRHAYYQWVPLVLMIQIAIYMFPKWFWDNLMDKEQFFESIICDLDKVSSGSIEDKVEDSARYFKISLSHHRTYAAKFMMCEILAFALAVGNLYLTNDFLGGDFFHFGRNAVSYITQPAFRPDNPLNEIFPKVAKCTWHKFGPSGTINTHDSLCVLPLNIVNEKTYIFLWIIYVTTAVVAGTVLLMHIILMLVKPLRNRYLMYLVYKDKTKKNLKNTLPKCNYGDWFIMYQFKTHMKHFSSWIARTREVINE